MIAARSIAVALLAGASSARATATPTSNATTTATPNATPTATPNATPTATPTASATTDANCPPSPVPAIRFPAGEQLRFRLDAFGADVGSFELSLEPPSPAEAKRAAYVVKSRSRTSAFVSTNVQHYEAFAVAVLGPKLVPLSYHEEVDEGQEHKSIQADFPPTNGKLAVRATKNGEPDPLSLEATPAARDMLSTIYVLRAHSLQPSAPICLEVFAGRHVWTLRGAVSGRESIDTPLGRFATVRLDATAVRTDDASVKRAAHFWLSEDDRRLPLVAIAEVRGKTIRAQLTAATGLPPAREESRKSTVDSRRPKAPIGRR